MPQDQNKGRKDLKIDVRARDEEGNIIIEGQLNRKEVAFLLQFSINQLMMDGVEFNLDEPDDEDNPQLRLNFEGAGGLN